jgi:hypothetical protein
MMLDIDPDHSAYYDINPLQIHDCPWSDGLTPQAISNRPLFVFDPVL